MARTTHPSLYDRYHRYEALRTAARFKTRGWQLNVKLWPDGRQDITRGLLLPSILIHMYYVVSLYKMAAESGEARSVTRNPTTPPDYFTPPIQLTNFQ
jgi:hypothetical protein